MTSNNHEWKMFKLALLIFIVSLLISKNSIEGDRNVNHRSLQSGNIQDLQPVNHFGNYPSRDEPINHSGDQGKEKRRSFLIEKRHQPLKSKPDPEKIPNVEKRKFFRGLLKIFHSKSQFFLRVTLNLGSRYQPRDYRRQSRYEKKMRRLKKKKKRQQFKKIYRRQYCNRKDRFACNNGGCIHITRKCNGYPECSDGSDEVSCGNRRKGFNKSVIITLFPQIVSTLE